VLPDLAREAWFCDAMTKRSSTTLSNHHLVCTLNSNIMIRSGISFSDPGFVCGTYCVEGSLYSGRFTDSWRGACSNILPWRGDIHGFIPFGFGNGRFAHATCRSVQDLDRGELHQFRRLSIIISSPHGTLAQRLAFGGNFYAYAPVCTAFALPPPQSAQQLCRQRLHPPPY
jgi:hypothetical protein